MKRIFSFTLLLSALLVCGCSKDDESENNNEVENKIPAEQTITVNDLTFKMIGVEGGTFIMGNTEGPADDTNSMEKPAHEVTLASFYIGETEVTQALWESVMGSNPSIDVGDSMPVSYVSWALCNAFIIKLNQITGKNFRMPTEAEWEFAARGGNKSHHYKYSGSDNIDEVGWHVYNSNWAPKNVALKAPNELGIYDMTGNVEECCQDWYGRYESQPQTNPTGPETGQYRVARGGAWGYNEILCTVTGRSRCATTTQNSNLGLRLVLDFNQ